MMNLVKRNNFSQWDPFKELEDFSGRLSRIFGRSEIPALPMADWTPRANILETPEHYEVEAELPQVKKDDVKVSLEGGVLTLSGERKYQKKEGGGAKPLRVESAYGSFVRSFALPEDADSERIDARYEDGMLHVKIGRIASKRPAPGKMIPVH